MLIDCWNPIQPEDDEYTMSEFTKDEIEVNHEWNTEEDDSNEIDIEITEDSLS